MLKLDHKPPDSLSNNLCHSKRKNNKTRADASWPRHQSVHDVIRTLLMLRRVPSHFMEGRPPGWSKPSLTDKAGDPPPQLLLCRRCNVVTARILAARSAHAGRGRAPISVRGPSGRSPPVDWRCSTDGMARASVIEVVVLGGGTSSRGCAMVEAIAGNVRQRGDGWLGSRSMDRCGSHLDMRALTPRHGGIVTPFSRNERAISRHITSSNGDMLSIVPT